MPSSSSSHTKPWIIGGPGTILPAPIESFLSWSLCVSCLSVSCYHYVRTKYVLPFYQRWKVSLSKMRLLKNTEEEEEFVHIPLTTHSRTEIKKCSKEERIKQLLLILHRYLKKSNCKKQQQTAHQKIDKTILFATEKKDEVAVAALSNEKKKDDNVSEAIQTFQEASNKTLIHLLRTEHLCRRLASLALRRPSTTNSSTSFVNIEKRLKSIYPQLLPLPPPPPFSSSSSSSSSEKLYTISLIIPLYRESVTDVKYSLEYAYQHCEYPKRVEIILVDANHEHTSDTTEMSDCKSSVYHSLVPHFHSSSSGLDTECIWKEIKVCIYTKGGGRGSSLHYGASQSTGGEIFTFCHSDTLLPQSWDVDVQKALSSSSFSEKDGVVEERVNACAFNFGVHRSTSNTTTAISIPPGLAAVETTANLRSKWFVLPYGDQTLSLYANVYHFLGGFPDQCLMEDYEFVSLLRQRSSSLHKEKLNIIPHSTALCSPRRWYKFGVLYVTYMNSKFVNLYAKGLSADDLYCLYYKSEVPPYRFYGSQSFWEVELEQMIGG